MTLKGVDIVKFLFPELQVIDTIKKKGFIARKNKNLSSGNVAMQSISQSNEQVRYMETSSSQQTCSSGEVNAVCGQDTATYQYNNKTKPDTSNIAETFEGVYKELSLDIIGQATYLKHLCTAFQRPFVAGFDIVKPKNNLLIIGGNGTGRHTSISRMAGSLKKRKLVNNSNIIKMDLSLYPTVAEFGVFLSDLYKCLYGQSDIVVFDGLDKCHSNIISVITELAAFGKYTLGARYAFQNNNLVETSGVLMQNSVSELYANGKYFVFITEKTEKDINEICGARFMNSIGDIIYVDNLQRADLMRLSQMVIGKVNKKCEQNLSMSLSSDNGVVELIASRFTNSNGVTTMEEFVTASIYMPLAEYKLRNQTKANRIVMLTVENSGLVACIDGVRIDLSEVIPKRQQFGLEDMKKELESIIGIESVKKYVLSLEDNFKIQKLREEAGFKTADISMHMIFTGNPGTGKTTIARIVAKYLKALGVLSTGQLREVTRADLVGQYVGHTARLTNDVIQSALGGVLFIDEAYSLCRDKHDTFGLEAIDALVKGIEDNRNDLVVILAGYKDEMNEFLKTNTGLKSRFPNIIEFEDYSPQEMYRIAQVTAKAKGYKVVESCETELVKLFEKKQIKGRNDNGNGRLVRNVIESAILNQSKRLLSNKSATMDLLEYDDFKFENTDSFDLEKSLSHIIGLDIVKEFVRTQHKLLIAQDKRRKAGIETDTTQSLNMIFYGNPGTGKTTIARVVAEMFKEMGLLKAGHLVETDRGGLVSEYVGQTAKKTEEVFKSALGGVLFIDEAYALANESGSFGKEAIDTLVKLVEDFRGEIVVILAGYKKEMSEFLKTNSGLESRFPLRIEFPDYSSEELFQISRKIISDKGFVLNGDTVPLLKEQIERLHKQSTSQSGNGRMIRNYVEEILRKQSARIASSDITKEEMNLVKLEDVSVEKLTQADFDLEDELSQVIGLEEVKNHLRSLSARLRMQSERKKLGIAVDSTQTLHMIFKGNPGTGKTMIARTVAKVLYNIGVINTDKLVETDKAGLVAGYVGQTAMKTREKVMEALDGVLFIDEAYSLSQGGENDFGKEAIDTLVKLIDDYRDRIVVILAGYNKEMDQFLLVNSGLKSRFPNIMEFSDYTPEELMQISENLFASKGFEMDGKANSRLNEILASARLEPDFGNGRYVRNLYEKAVNNQALRLSSDVDLTREELITITDVDIERV